MKPDKGKGLPVDPLYIPLLMSLPGVGARHYWRLRKLVGDVSNLPHWPLGRLLSLLPESCHQAFTDIYRHSDESRTWQQFRQRVQRLPDGVAIISHDHPRFPSLLAEIHQTPPVLYVLGNTEALNLPQVAFVGSRNATVYGLEAAFDFARYLAGIGIAITSGLAAGIDASAHRGALAARGITLAVLGTGIDIVYPSRHRRLVAEILDANGVVISEFAPGTQPLSRNFPQRNRIISGLSLGVLVVEAAIRSGSLITARHALEQNREVFAVPGSINNPLSRGCHQLIRDGAALVETAEDIGRQLGHWLSEPSIVAASPPANSGELPVPECIITREDLALWSVLHYEPRSIDDLVQRSSLPTAAVLTRLSGWEIQGLVVKDRECYLRSPGF